MLRSVHDREIALLALPALGALAAEPLYLLVDTAIVGHLGTPQLAALAIAATVLTTVVSLCIFLTYGTTAQVARLHGAGDAAQAGQLAAQALWLATALGAALALVCVAFAGPIAGLGAYIPIALLALALDWGIQGVWAGLLALMALTSSMPSSKKLGSKAAISSYARRHCVSVAKPSARSTSTRPYHERSSTAIPPQPGSAGMNRTMK